VSLACADCDAPHDLDLGPDDGTCIVCGGTLIQDEKERGEVGLRGKVLAQAIVEAVNDGIAKMALARGKAPQGEN
jgi:hypothetical protein